MAYKINSFNYSHIRNSIFKNGVATTSKAYGIDKTTLRYVKECATFDDYKNFIAQKSREQYEKRIKKQRERMFGNGIHFDGKVELNKEKKEEPKTQPFDTTPELGRAKTIVTEVEEHETPKDLSSETVRLWKDKPEEEEHDTVDVENKQKRGRRGITQPELTAEMFNIAVEMARNGELKGDIAKRLGYNSAANLTYHLTKNPAWADAFNRALADGKAQYIKNLGKRIGGDKKRMEDMRNASNAIRAAIKAEQPTVDKPLTFTRKAPASNGMSSYLQGLETGAKKMGMTVEEYKEWRKKKLAEAREKRWNKYYETHDMSERTKKRKGIVLPESYEDMIKRQDKEENAKNSEDSERPVETRDEGVITAPETKPSGHDTVVERQGTGVGDDKETVDTDKQADPQVGTDVADSDGKKDHAWDIPTPSRFATYTVREERLVPTSTEENVHRETEDNQVPVRANTEAAQTMCTCQSVGRARGNSAYAHGVNSLLESIGSAIKVIAIGVLALLLALAAQKIILAIGSSQVQIDPSTCKYTGTSWGIETVECSTI